MENGAMTIPTHQESGDNIDRSREQLAEDLSIQETTTDNTGGIERGARSGMPHREQRYSTDSNDSNSPCISPATSNATNRTSNRVHACTDVLDGISILRSRHNDRARLEDNSDSLSDRSDSNCRIESRVHADFYDDEEPIILPYLQQILNRQTPNEEIPGQNQVAYS